MARLNAFQEARKYADKLKTRSQGLVNAGRRAIGSAGGYLAGEAQRELQMRPGSFTRALTQPARDIYQASKPVAKQVVRAATPIAKPVYRATKQQVGGLYQGFTEPPDKFDTNNPTFGYAAGKYFGVGAPGLTQLPSAAGKLYSTIPRVANELSSIGKMNPYYTALSKQGERLSKKDPATGLAFGLLFGRAGMPPTANKPYRVDIHPEDWQVMKNFGAAVDKGGGKKNLGQLGVDASRVVERYFGKKYALMPNKKIQQLFDYALAKKFGSGPEGGIVVKPKGFKLPVGLSAQEESGLAQQASGYSKETTNYLTELKKSQQKASKSVEGTTISKLKSKIGELKTGFVDEQSAIEDAISSAERKGKFKILPKYDIRVHGIDRVLKSKELSAQFIKDKGLFNVIKNTDDVDALNQYLIAKQSLDVSKQGKITGRNLLKDRKLIEELGPKYEQQAQQVNKYTKALKQYLVDSGLISKDLSNTLDKKYPHYVPLNRIFNEIEKQNLYQGGGKQIASLGKQTIVQKLQGSEREIANPLDSLLLKTEDALQQGERNKTAKMLANYRTLPGFEGLIKEAGEGAKHTFSYLENGVKKTFETTPEIAAAAKNLNREQMGLLVKILSPVTRSLQLGATGLNAPFVITNVVKDELTGFVNSNRAASTSILNPINFVRSLFSALKHDDLYDEVLKQGGMQTSFDISRAAPETTIKSIRAQRNLISKVKYNVSSLPKFLRAVEDIVGKGEELGRIKNYAGMRDRLLSEGRTLEDAKILAAQAARENTANFARKGSWGRTLNYIIPFFNAGIQGSRQLVRSFQNNPKGTSMKLAVGVFTPVAAATAWNLSDPQRKAAYEDISNTEKQSNILIVPPNPTQDETGKWNVIKIPLPPGISNLASLVRRPMEQAEGLDPVRFGEIASNLITAGTSIDTTSPTRLISSVIPQAIKLPAEGILNRNFYTGKDIVPSYFTDKPAEEQVFKDTSGTARLVGRATNISPLKVENALRTGLGGLGSQLLNASDRALLATGQIPEEQVGGEGALANLRRRFTQSYGGETKRKAEAESAKINSFKKQAIQAYLEGDIEKTKEIMRENKIQITNKDIKSQTTTQKDRALEAYLNGDIGATKSIMKQYKISITNADVKKKAKSKAVSNYKKYMETGNEYYLSQAKELISKYGVSVSNRDVQ